MTRTSVASARAFLHPFLSVLLVFVFVQAFDAVVRVGIFGALIPAMDGYLLVVLAAGVSQTLVANMLSLRRVSGVLPRVREILLTLAAALVLLWLISGRPFRGDFVPWRADVIWPLVLCAAQWILTLYAQSAFRSREMFMTLISDRTGHDLVRIAREASAEAGEAQVAMRKLKTLSVVFDVFALLPYLGLLATLAVTGKGPVAPAVTLRVTIQAVWSIAFIAIANSFNEEHLTSASGVTPEAPVTATRFGMPLGGVAALFLVGLVIAGGSSLLPIAWIGRLITWISDLAGQGSFNGAMGLSSSEAMPGTSSSKGGMDLPPVVPSPVADAIWRIVGICIAAAAVFGVLFFVVRPLLARATRRSARGLHPLRFLRERALLFLRALGAMPGRLAALLRASGRGLRAIPRAIIPGARESTLEARANAARTQARLRVSVRAVREFHRITRWGARAGVPFTATEGPRDYVRRLAVRAPAKEPALLEAAALMEELVYGEATAGNGERALARIINGIVR